MTGINTIGVIYKVITIFLLICFGYAMRKLEWLDDRLSKGISKLVICGAQPFMIVSKIIAISYSAENVITGGWILLISFAIQAVLAVLAFLFAKPIRQLEKRKISEFALLFVNCGFVGIPLMEAAFGVKGAFWSAVYVIAYNLLQWSYGMVLLSQCDASIRINFKKAILNYGTVPCIVGMLLFVTGVGGMIPTAITDAMNTVGNLCTPLSMLVIGGLLATIPIKKLFLCGKVYYVCLLKLVLFPVIIFALGKLVGLPNDYTVFAAMMAALPSAANTGVFGEQYDIEPQYASHLVGMTTVFSALSIPLLVLLAEQFL